MRKIKYFLIVFLTLLALTANEVISQTSFGWKWLHPKPQGNNLLWVKVFDANNWYAGGRFGMFMKTSDAGATWTFNSNAGWQQSAAFSYGGARRDAKTAWFFNQNTGIVAGTGYGILRTTNAGQIFDSIAVLTAGLGTVNGIYFINSATGFLCGSTLYSIMKTVNGGLNWVSCNAPVTTYYAVTAADSNNIFCAVETGNIQKSTDGGNSWTEIITGTTRTIFDLKFINANTGYACTGYGGFLFTTNGGNTWTSANTPNISYKNTLMKLLVSGNTVYTAGNDTLIYKTTNNGTTWDSIRHYSGQYFSYMQFDLGKSGSTMVLVGHSGNISKSTNDGLNWTNLNVRNSMATLSTIFVESSTGNIWAAGGAGNNDAVLYTSNGGTNWITQNAQTALDIYDIKMVNSNTGIICGLSGLIKKTTNKGTNWTNITSPLGPEYSYSSLDFIDNNTGWIVGGWTTSMSSSSCIIKTTNGGSNFVVQVPANDKPLTSVDFVDFNTGWACGTMSVVRTTNGGVNWTAVPPPAPVIYLRLKAINGNTAFVCGQSAKIYKTTNGGVNWDSVPSPMWGLTWFATDWINQNTGIVAGSNGATARTTNAGQTWYLTNSGGGESIQYVVMKAVDTIFACTYSAQLLKSTESIITNVLKFENTVPQEYELEQNYPNPFNPVTTIKFSLPKASVITLKVFDIAGREVTELINNMSMNKGTFSYMFSAQDISSGVYFYSLIADGKITATKKMILIK